MLGHQHEHGNHKCCTGPTHNGSVTDLSSLTVTERKPKAAERLAAQGLDLLKAVAGLSREASAEACDLRMEQGEWRTDGKGIAPEAVQHVVVQIDHKKIREASPDQPKTELRLEGFETEEAALCSAYGRLIENARSAASCGAADPAQTDFKFTESLTGTSVIHGDTVVGVLPKDANAVVTFVREHGGGKYYDLEPYRQKRAD